MDPDLDLQRLAGCELAIIYCNWNDIHRREPEVPGKHVFLLGG